VFGAVSIGVFRCELTIATRIGPSATRMMERMMLVWIVFRNLMTLMSFEKVPTVKTPSLLKNLPRS
jgi:hypothetical protein